MVCSKKLCNTFMSVCPCISCASTFLWLSDGLCGPPPGLSDCSSVSSLRSVQQAGLVSRLRGSAHSVFKAGCIDIRAIPGSVSPRFFLFLFFPLIAIDVHCFALPPFITPHLPACGPSLCRPLVLSARTGSPELTASLCHLRFMLIISTSSAGSYGNGERHNHGICAFSCLCILFILFFSLSLLHSSHNLSVCLLLESPLFMLPSSA